MFFAVVLRTCCRARRSSRSRGCLGVTSDEQALPAPLLEAGAVRRLGAEVWSTRCRPATPRSGHRVRDLGLPRDALLNLIVRGDQAILPRGSTACEAGDHLHVLVRQEAARRLCRASQALARGTDGFPRMKSTKKVITFKSRAPTMLAV